ncbi:hypothetical protein HAX54_028432, partial [Datura stramonium]|nr:hypothetical protein [Datura stramonium]
GKVVGDPGKWNVVRYNRCRDTSDVPPTSRHPTLTNKFQALSNGQEIQAEHSNTSNYTNCNNNKGEIKEEVQEGDNGAAKSLGEVLLGRHTYSQGGRGQKLKTSMKEKVVDTTTLDSKEEQIFKDADLSPRAVKALKSSRKGKKQGKGEAEQPVIVQPKRQVTFHQSKNQ